MPRQLTTDQMRTTRAALEACEGNRAAAARALGISLPALYYRLQRMDQVPPARRNRLTTAQLVERHLPVVDRLAAKYKAKLPASVSIDDLVQVGRIGLMEAAQSFDPARGIKFTTYCSARVYGAMVDELRRQDPVPRLSREREKARKACETQLARENLEASPAAVRARLGWSEDVYRDSFPRSDQSLDQPVFSTERREVSTGDLFVAVPPPPTLDRDEAAREMLRGLPLEQLVLVYLYYWRGTKMNVIAQALGLSESRISQLHSQILERLRAEGRDRFLERCA